MAIKEAEICVPEIGMLHVCPSKSSIRVMVQDADEDTAILHVPEAEWRRLCRESCGTEAGLLRTQDGFGVEILNDESGNNCIRIFEMRPNGRSVSVAGHVWVEAWDNWKRFSAQESKGWQDGPPTEKYVPYAIEYRAHIIPHKKIELRVFAGTLQRIIEDADPVLYAFGEDFPIPNGPGEVTIPQEDIVRHFRVPDPPKAEPVPEPPKWVRMKCVKHHQNFAPGDMGWACRQFKVWHVVPDGNRENWMYNAIVDDGEWEPVE